MKIWTDLLPMDLTLHPIWLHRNFISFVLVRPTILVDPHLKPYDEVDKGNIKFIDSLSLYFRDKAFVIFPKAALIFTSLFKNLEKYYKIGLSDDQPYFSLIQETEHFYEPLSWWTHWMVQRGPRSRLNSSLIRDRSLVFIRLSPCAFIPARY